MANQKFFHSVSLQPLPIPNQSQADFRAALDKVPYLLYEAEQLADGGKIVINKPGGKRNFGCLARNDFMVFIWHPDNSLWLISHKEISEDLALKREENPNNALKIVKGLFSVCCGEEPDEVIKSMGLSSEVGIPVDTLFKAYKWIWGQEDCNYPAGEGRWKSMNGILDDFQLSRAELEVERG